jgi:hypothetical protein
VQLCPWQRLMASIFFAPHNIRIYRSIDNQQHH